MYRSILVPMDGTAFGEHALALAATLARATGATLHLAHVHVPMVAPVGMEAVASAGPWNDILMEQEGGYLQSLSTRLAQTYGTRVRYQVMDGAVCEALEDYARQCGADLLVMSTHGHSGVSRVWHHCLAEQMARDLPIPVLLLHPTDEEREADLSAAHELKHVLIPLDGSGSPESTLEEAVKLGRGFRARYTLLRVIPPAAGSHTLSDAALGRRGMERDQLAAHQYLNAFAERLRAAGVEARTEVRVGNVPAEAIVRFVRDSLQGGVAVDLVAMERRPHRGFGQALTTHTTEAVVRDAGIPVLVVQGPLSTSSSRRAARRGDVIHSAPSHPHASRSVTLRLASAEDVPPLGAAFEREGWPQPIDALERYLADQRAGLRLFLLALVERDFAGYLTLAWDADYAPFHEEGIPEIQDLRVLPSFRRRAVATQLLAVAEKQAAERSDRLGLGVGLYAAYGPAHRLYATRGYHPVGEGVTAGGRPLLGGEVVSVDDGLVLHLVKRLRA